MKIKHKRGSRKMVCFDFGETVPALGPDGEFEISISYTGHSNAGNAIILDNTVIPAIVDAINNLRSGVERQIDPDADRRSEPAVETIFLVPAETEVPKNE